MAKTPKHQKASASYFEKHGRLLRNIVDDYKQSIVDTNLFATTDYAIFNVIQQGITRHALRYYQMDALYLLDYIYSHAQAELKLKEQLPSHRIKDFIADLLDEIEDQNKAPFLAYEMATGAGKTMLMGASIYFLNKKYGINNFLIITPASTDIYQKTIRNFEIGNYESVWADDTPFTFNLITGDNYKQNLFYDSSKDANIFIFNISKFGTNATNTERTWESAIWQDNNGNNISIKQFFKDRKLVIITDEAHHAQTKAANTIIKNFHPSAVLEFTATGIEDGSGQSKKNQNIIYKYDIKKFLEDGHGKLVRAVALASVERQRRGIFNENEKLKIITLLLIHLLKKESVLLDLKCRGLKPISFVKVKEDTNYTQKVFDYIRAELSSDVDNIELILTKVKEQDLEITDLLSKLFKNKYQNELKLLRDDIQRVADTAIFYYGKSDKETEKKFLNIRKNEVELVVYMQRLDEGIDLPNIFSMAVVNDSDTDFKTSVKQIIGRGVRLNKDKREFDEETNLLKANSEKLHIVCDQGNNFEQVISAIQQEFGLNNKYLSFDKIRKPIINKAKAELLSGKYIPHIKADFKAREGVSLIELIKDVNTITSKFVEDNCFEGQNDITKQFLKYRPDSFFIEVDIFSDKNIYHKQIQQNGGVATRLRLTDKEIRTIYGIVQKNLHCLPDSETSRKAFRDYISRLNEIGLQYYRIDSADDKLAVNLFVNAFSFFYRNHIEKNYFRLDFRQLQEEDSWNLKQRFTDYELKLPEDQIDNKARIKVKDKTKLIDLISNQYYFYGYEKSIYDYEKYDSFVEYQLAEYADVILKKVALAKKPFWIRNQHNVWFTYGSKKYYPDFIMFKDDMIYVIETKGEIFSDTKKNTLLKKLDEVPGQGDIKGFKGLLIFSSQMDKMGSDFCDFDKFIAESENTLRRHQSKADLISDPPIEERYTKYVPVYSPGNAFKKFIKQQKTPKPEGWLEVEIREGGYHEAVFATQVKGSALLPEYAHNSWVILTHSKNLENALNNLCLVHHKDISEDDGYDSNYTLRILSIEEKKTKEKLFGNRLIKLCPINPEVDAINIPFEASSGEFDIIGIGLPPK